jgi:hypothetical protein
MSTHERIQIFPVLLREKFRLGDRIVVESDDQNACSLAAYGGWRYDLGCRRFSDNVAPGPNYHVTRRTGISIADVRQK